MLTGDSENSNLLSQFLEGFNIFCMTPQILLNNLERNPDHLSIHSFTLIIFDECHHAKKEEPYNKVMRKYLSEKLGPSTIKLPQVLKKLFNDICCTELNRTKTTIMINTNASFILNFTFYMLTFSLFLWNTGNMTTVLMHLLSWLMFQ